MSMHPRRNCRASYFVNEKLRGGFLVHVNEILTEDKFSVVSLFRIHTQTHELCVCPRRVLPAANGLKGIAHWIIYKS